MRRSRKKTDDFDLLGPPEYTQTPKLTSSRHPTIHLSKNNGCFQPKRQWQLSSPLPWLPVLGSGILSSIPTLSTGCSEESLRRFRTDKFDTYLPVGKEFIGQRPAKTFARRQSQTLQGHVLCLHLVRMSKRVLQNATSGIGAPLCHRLITAAGSSPMAGEQRDIIWQVGPAVSRGQAKSPAADFVRERCSSYTASHVLRR